MIDLSEKRMIGPAIRLHSRDNVLIARVDLAIGTPIPSENITSRSQVAAGNKIAARAIARGEAIRKYDVVIGFAAADIPAGTGLGSSGTFTVALLKALYAYTNRIHDQLTLAEDACDIEINKQIERMAKGMKLSSDALLAQLKKDGISQDVFRRLLRQAATTRTGRRRCTRSRC